MRNFCGWHRGVGARIAAGLVVLASLAPLQSARADDFSAFVNGLWPDAQAHGVRRSTFDAAFDGVTPDPAVIEKTRTQAEFRKTVAEYLSSAVSDKRIALGQDRYKESERWLSKAEARYGVDRFVIMGVWGLETKFGTYMGDNNVIRALATLAAAHYRGTYFRGELVKALVILEEGHIDAPHMIGSWAGAMGQTQFMPSNFKPYAVDFDGDGRRDIWTNVPDALGSTANFLRRHGWVPGQGWGYEVVRPDDAIGSPGPADGRHFASFSDWHRQGYQRADGEALPAGGRAALLMPAGRDGPVFLVTPNFNVIKRYNNSTSYALGVALLGDRIAGWGPLKAQWPVASR